MRSKRRFSDFLLAPKWNAPIIRVQAHARNMKFTPQLTESEVEAAMGGKYSSISFVASGGQGVVMKGIRAYSSDAVALKVYFPGSLEERTRREVDALRRISCSSLVSIIDAGEVQLRGSICVYVATAFVDGRPLSEAIALAPSSEVMVAKVGVAVANAIAALWISRIVHRDIKPQNIMLNGAGEAVVIDLGVARHLGLSSLTTAGKTWGTEGYMSPEHARTLKQLSCKSDIFSLGVTLQECLVGRHPTGRNQLALMAGGPKTATLGCRISPHLAALIDLMVDRQPQRRPSPLQVIERIRSSAPP